uniref:BACK domain-containing protein n=2 Tax=Capitella teleta TaxID=283909 RepID=X2AG43_CAPTE
MLLLGALKKKVEEFLLSNTDSVNCISIMNLARLYDMKTLLADARSYLQEHVKEVVETEEMHLLQEGDLIEVLEANDSQEDNFLFIQNTVIAEKLMHNTRCLSSRVQEFMRSSGSADPPKQLSLAVSNDGGEMWLCTDLNTLKWQPIQQPPFEIHDYSACASPG